MHASRTFVEWNYINWLLSDWNESFVPAKLEKERERERERQREKKNKFEKTSLLKGEDKNSVSSR